MLLSWDGAPPGQGLPAPALVVLTHWHWDHSFGLAGLTCPSLAGEHTQRELERVSRWGWTEEEMARRLATGEELPFCDTHLRREYPCPAAIAVSPADLTFSGRLRLDLGGVVAEFLELPDTHSGDAVAVLLPGQSFAFLGDMICGDFYGRDGGYDPARLRQMLAALEALPFTRCVTGHDLPEEKASLLAELRAELHRLEP